MHGIMLCNTVQSVAVHVSRSGECPEESPGGQSLYTSQPNTVTARQAESHHTAANTEKA